MTRERNFALFVYLGIEVRNFLFNGLVERLSRLGGVSLLTHQRSSILERHLGDVGVGLIPLDIARDLVLQRHRLEAYFLASRRARLRLHGIPIFKLWRESGGIRRRDRVLGSMLVYALLRRITFSIIRSHYYNCSLADKLREHAITDVFLQSYFTPQNMTAALTAQKTGCRVWVVNWSWKDFFINEFIPFRPALFLAWSRRLEALYREVNRHIPPDCIVGAGNLAFDAMFDYAPRRPVEYYAAKYKFDAMRPIVLYTLVHPRIFPREEALVTLLRHALSSADCRPVTILVKPNPMDTNLERFQRVALSGHVAILDSNWEYDQENDFNMITADGQVEWLDLLHYCVATVNVPSTVTLESLIMGRPVVNPLYDDTGSVYPDFERLFRTPFYEAAARRQDVVGAYSLVEAAAAIERALSGALRVEEPLNDLIDPRGSALETLMSAVEIVEAQ